MLPESHRTVRSSRSEICEPGDGDEGGGGQEGDVDGEGLGGLSAPHVDRDGEQLDECEAGGGQRCQHLGDLEQPGQDESEGTEQLDASDELDGARAEVRAPELGRRTRSPPLGPGPVKYSAFARNTTLRGATIGITTLSAKLR